MSDWVLECVTVGPLQMNAWLLLAERSQEAVLIDPGDEAAILLERLDRSGCRLRWLVATHGHFDHVGAAAEIQDVWGLPLLVHAADVPLIEAMAAHQAAFGLPQSRRPQLDPSLADGRHLDFAGDCLTVTEVPGHSPGHVMLTWPGHAVTGDCIFAGSVGRTDLPGGDFATLAASIRGRIYALPPATVLHPGHGPDTTVAREQATNPFVAGA